MVVLNKANTADAVRLTLTESLTITPTHYKLVFTSRQTKQVITVDNLTDVSAYPARYNRFTVNTQTAFANMPEGFWDYTAYAVGTTTELLEEGAMKLNGDAFSFTAHTPVSNTYKAYQG